MGWMETVCYKVNSLGVFPKGQTEELLMVLDKTFLFLKRVVELDTWMLCCVPSGHRMCLVLLEEDRRRCIAFLNQPSALIPLQNSTWYAE